MKYKPKVQKIKPNYVCESHGATKAFGGEQIVVYAIFDGKEQITQWRTKAAYAWQDAYTKLTGHDPTDR